MSNRNSKLAYSIAEVVTVSSICRAGVYTQIKGGKLKIRKIGNRTIVLAEDLAAWLKGNEPA
jgi:hypothetical protein